MTQELIVALLVPLCLLYVLWAVLPAAAKRALAGGLLRRPGAQHWLGRVPLLRRALEKAARGAGGCACSGGETGCPAAGTTTSAGGVQPVKFVRRAVGHPPKPGAGRQSGP
jgi:hypothetical protein